MSYSVYLVHPLFLDAYDRIPFARSYYHQPWLQAGASIGFVVVLLACCALTYYLVEAPMQRLGRRAAARLDARFGEARSVVGLADAEREGARPADLTR